MKNLNITYDDEDFKFIENWKNKTGLSWEDFIKGCVILVNKHDIKEYAYIKREKGRYAKREILKDVTGGDRKI